MNKLGGDTAAGFEPLRQPDFRWEVFSGNLAYEMVEEARRMRRTGVSHRGFKVGSTGLLFDDDRKPVRAPGANRSPFRGSRKNCGEKNVMEYAAWARLPVYAISISGPPQRDQISKVESATLQSCHFCRQNFAEDISKAFDPETDGVPKDGKPQVIFPGTILLSSHHKREVHEIYTVQELLDMHARAMYGGDKPELRAYTSLDLALEDFQARHPEIIYGTDSGSVPYAIAGPAAIEEWDEPSTENVLRSLLSAEVDEDTVIRGLMSGGETDAQRSWRTWS